MNQGIIDAFTGTIRFKSKSRIRNNVVNCIPISWAFRGLKCCKLCFEQLCDSLKIVRWFKIAIVPWEIAMCW